MPVHLCFDHGEKRVGVALGDDLTGAARPLPAITDGDWTAIGRVIADWRPAALIVGLPLNDDGSEQKASVAARRFAAQRSEEHTSELQSLMRISYAVFCLKKKNNNKPTRERQLKR